MIKIAIEIKAEAKRIIISGSIKPVKQFVREYFVKDIDELGLTDCSIYESIPADDINEMPPYAELNYDGELLVKLGKHLQILFLSAESTEFAAEIIKGTVPGKIYDRIKKAKELDKLELYFEYYPIAF